MNRKVKSIDVNNFSNEIIHSKDTVIVLYWANWCNPCKIIEPVFKLFSNIFLPHIKISKINIGELYAIPEFLTVKCTPTIALFKDGQKIKELSGNINLEDLKNLVLENTNIKKQSVKVDI